MIKVYLAGGFKSAWQEKVKGELVGLYEFLDPSMHHIEDPVGYTHMDLEMIRNSDIILAYMEKDNPGGYALSLEIGYAWAKCKHVFLVDDPDRKHFDMVRQCNDEIFPDLDSAIEYMKYIAK